MIRTCGSSSRYFLTAVLFLFTLSLGTTVNPLSAEAANTAPQFTSSSGLPKAIETDRFQQVATVHKKAKKAAKKAKKKTRKATKKVGKGAGKAAKKTGKAVKKKVKAVGKVAISGALVAAAFGADVGKWVADQISKWGCLGVAQMLKSPKLANELVKKTYPTLKKWMKKHAKSAGLASINPVYFDDFRRKPGHYGPLKLASLSNVYEQPNYGLLQYAAASEPVVMSDAVVVEVAALKTSKIYNAAMSALKKQSKNVAEVTRLAGVMAAKSAKVTAAFLNPHFLCTSTAKEKQKKIEKLGLKPNFGKLDWALSGPEPKYAAVDSPSGRFLDKLSLISRAHAKKKKKKAKRMWHGFSVGIGAEAVQGVGLGFLFITDWKSAHHGFFYLERTVSGGLEVPVGVGASIRTFFFTPSNVGGFVGEGYGLGIAAGGKLLAKVEIGIDIALTDKFEFAGVGAGIDVGAEAATGPSAGGSFSADYAMKMY